MVRTPLVRVSAGTGCPRRSGGEAREPRVVAGARGQRRAPRGARAPARRSTGPRGSRRGSRRRARPSGPRPRRTPGRRHDREAASRLPYVMVPVLSSRMTSTSPEASTARPLIASTLNRATRSMPAMPMADSSPPMVVGMRHTRSATRATIVDGHAGELAERDAGSRSPSGTRASAPRAGSRARSRWVSAGAGRPRRARSSGRGTSRPGRP